MMVSGEIFEVAPSSERRTEDAEKIDEIKVRYASRKPMVLVSSGERVCDVVRLVKRRLDGC
jgi:hypothetical protein